MPVAGLPMRSSENGAQLIIINNSPTYLDDNVPMSSYVIDTPRSPGDPGGGSRQLSGNLDPITRPALYLRLIELVEFGLYARPGSSDPL